MFNVTIESIVSDPAWISAIAAVAFGIIGFLAAIWFAYFAPQAVQSKIEKKKYLDEKRKEHYIRLDQEFFKPLSTSIFIRRSSTVTDELDSLKIEFMQLDEKSSKKGIDHLKIDKPDCFAEYESLPGTVKKYNSKLQEFYNTLDSDIRNEFRGILELNETYVPEQDCFMICVKQVKEVVLILFSRFLNNIPDYDKSAIQKACMSAIFSDLDRRGHGGFIGKSPLQPFGIGITNIHFELPIDIKNPEGGMTQRYIETEQRNQQEIQVIIKHICTIVSNESTFKKFRELMKMREDILNIEKKISQEFNRISISINKGDYETIAECCNDKKFW